MEVLDKNEEHYLIRVVHSCGHDQVFEKPVRLVELADAKEPGYLERSASFLERNLCPGCYRFYGRPSSGAGGRGTGP